MIPRVIREIEPLCLRKTPSRIQFSASSAINSRVEGRKKIFGKRETFPLPDAPYFMRGKVCVRFLKVFDDIS